MSWNNRWLVLAVVSSALLLIVIDMTVLYTALPRLTQELQASPSEKLWIVNAYALTVAGLLPASGALGDRYGAKPLFLGGLLVFGLASLLAAFAPSPNVLIGGRVALAIGAAMMMPATLSIIRHTFEDERERSLAIGIWAAIASGGAAFGPILGGFLLEFFWWGSVFLINVPIVALALVLGSLFVPNKKGSAHHPFSLMASVQIMVGLVASTLAIKEFGKPEPSLAIAAIAGVTGIVFVSAFIRGQRRAARPMLDLRLFANASFSGGVIAALIAASALIGLELAMTQRFQLVLGLSPLEAGIRLLPLPLAAFLAGPVAGRLLPRFGMRMLPVSMALMAVGGLIHLFGMQSLVVEIVSMVVIGIGVGATMTSASASILHNATAESAGTAASVEEVSFELGGAMGVTIFGSALAAIYTHAFEGDGVAAEGIDQAMRQAQSLTGPASDALQRAAAAAFNLSFMSVLAAATAIVLAGAALVAWMATRTEGAKS